MLLPRTSPWHGTSRDRACSSSPWSRRMRTAMGWCRSPGRSSKGAPMASAWRPSMRLSRSGRLGSRDGSPSSIRSRRTSQRRQRRAGSPSLQEMARSLLRSWRGSARRTRGPRRPNSRSSSRSRRGSDAAAWWLRMSLRQPRRSRPRTGLDSPASGRTSRRRRINRGPPPRSRASRRRSRRSPRPGYGVPRRHLAASAGLLLEEIPSYDAVRPGLMTYGIAPEELDPSSLPSAASRLRPVMSLKARPVRVAELPAGHGISYGPTFETGRPSRIATLPLGYGDGWPRSLSNRAQALVRGGRVPLVGNVAMDAIMFDVTDVPGPPVGVEDEFVLLGEQGSERITALELARARTTNSWEVVTTTSRRLPRVYHASAGPVGIRTLASVEGAWLESNSGTETSASLRSTRS